MRALPMRTPALRALALPALLALGLLFPMDAVLPTGAPHLTAQVVERERQQELAPALGIVQIDAQLRSRLGLFPGVEGFRVARLLLRADGTTILELESVRDGRIERERRILTAADLDNLRSDLEARLATRQTVAADSQEGRGGLVLSQTLLGLGYFGWAVPVVLDVNSAQGAVASYLLTAGASFLVPYRLTRDRAVLESHRDLSWYGGTRGIGAGLLVGDMLVDSDRSSAGRTRLGGGIALGWAGAFAGFMVADRTLPVDGTASLWMAMGDLGAASGAALAYVSGPYAERTTTEVINPGTDHEFTVESSEARNRPLGHGITLAGWGAGLAAGAAIDRRYPMTEGNVTVFRSASVLGAQAGITVGRAASDEGRVVVAGGLAGALAATAFSASPLSDRHFTTGEGLLVAAGHLAGGATALGLTYLVIEDIDDNAVTYLTTSTLGSLVGAGLVFRALTPGSAPQRLRQDAMRIEVNPAALLTGWLASSEAGVRPHAPPPLVTIRF